MCQRFWSTRRTKHLSTSHLSLLPRLDSCKDIWEDSGRFSATFVTQKSIQNAFTSSYVRHAVITTTQSLCISQRRTQKMSDHTVQFLFHYKALFIWRAVGPGHPPTRANFTVLLYEKKKTWTGLWWVAPLKGLKYQRAHALRDATWPGWVSWLAWNRLHEKKLAPPLPPRVTLSWQPSDPTPRARFSVSHANDPDDCL